MSRHLKVLSDTGVVHGDRRGKWVWYSLDGTRLSDLRRALSYSSPMGVLILGAGFGGLELACRLSDEFGDEIEIDLLDKSAGFVFGFSKLDVIFGKTTASHVFHPYSSIAKPGLRFTQTTVRSINPEKRSVVTDAGTFESDIMVVALGADLDPSATPGLVDGGHEFYTVDGAFGLREVLEAFEGGRVIVGVTSTPFKCPPAPSETALLMHDSSPKEEAGAFGDLARDAVRRTYPTVSRSFEGVARRICGTWISWHPERLVTGLDAENKAALLSDGSSMEYDLFLGVPVHKAPAVVAESGLAANGWIAVDSLTLETDVPGVYAIGDVTSVGTPKAGVFAEGQASVVADHSSRSFAGRSTTSVYDGHGTCYPDSGTGWSPPSMSLSWVARHPWGR